MISITIASIFVIFAILEGASSIPDDDIGITTETGDVSNWFSLIITVIVSPIIAVWVGIFFYKRQRRDEERRRRNQENAGEIGEYRSRLDDVINPLIKNITNLQNNYKRYSSYPGPYPLNDFDEKDLLLEQLRLIIERYNQRQNPDEELIERINVIRNSCQQFPELRMYQFNSKMVMINDTTECNNIHQLLQPLINDIESQRNALEEKIGHLSDNEN